MLPAIRIPKSEMNFAPCVTLIFLSRRNFSEGGCSMKITENVRKFAAEQKLSEEQALQVGLEQKAKEFKEAGAEVYARA
jgi:hypothetical protein